MQFHVEDQPDPLDIDVLEAQIRREASAATGLGDEVDLAIFVRVAGTVVAGISGWTWGDCCELQNLWVESSLRGRGLATELIRAALDGARADGLMVEPFCPFVRAFIQKNSDYRELVPADEWDRFGL